MSFQCLFLLYICHSIVFVSMCLCFLYLISYFNKKMFQKTNSSIFYFLICSFFSFFFFNRLAHYTLDLHSLVVGMALAPSLAYRTLPSLGSLESYLSSSCKKRSKTTLSLPSWYLSCHFG